MRVMGPPTLATRQTISQCNRRCLHALRFMTAGKVFTSGVASMLGSGGALMSMTQGRMGWNAELPIRRPAR